MGSANTADPHCSTHPQNTRKRSARTPSMSSSEAVQVTETDGNNAMAVEDDARTRPIRGAQNDNDQTVAPPRKRARQKKTAINTEEPDDAEPSNSLTKQTEKEPDLSPPKKRGRPNKTAKKAEETRPNDAEPSTSQNQQEEEGDSLPPPKRRGRSKGIPAETKAIPEDVGSSHSHTEHQTNHDSVETNPAPDSVSHSGKRGRPRKTAKKTGGTSSDDAKPQAIVATSLRSSPANDDVSARPATRYSLRTRGQTAKEAEPEEAANHVESDSETVVTVTKKRRGKKPAAKPDRTEVPSDDESNPREKKKPKPKKKGYHYVRKKSDLRCKAKNSLLDKVDNDANGEPGICTRCGNIKASMDHFLRVHNAMLAEEERTFDLAAKRLRYLLVRRKRQKLRCQIETCKKVMMSVTAMAYHEQSCGKTQEQIMCTRCEKLISKSCYRQHELEHDRAMGIFQRKKFLMQMPNFGAKTMDSQTTTEKTDDTEFAAENEPSSSTNSRPRRLCAIAAAKKLHRLITGILDDSDADEHYENDSGSSSEGSSDDEGDSEESEAESDDQNAALPTSTFLPSQKFPRVDLFWKQSLAVVNYALCYNSGCDFMAGSFAEIIAHHKRCDFGRARRNRLRYQCAVERCRGRFVSYGHLVDHCVGKHGMSQENAKNMAKRKRIPYLEQKRKEAEPSQKEIDDLHLFEGCCS